MNNSESPGGPQDRDDSSIRPAPAEIIAHMARLNPVYEMLDLELLEAARGYSRFAMPITPRLGNTFGNAHGGLVFAFADICFGFTANAARNIRGVSSSAEIHWLAPGLVGERLIGETREVWQKGRNGLYDVKIWSDAQGDGSGMEEVIAIVHGRMRFIGGDVLSTQPG